jgi:hypothetical protein
MCHGFLELVEATFTCSEISTLDWVFVFFLFDDVDVAVFITDSALLVGMVFGFFILPSIIFLDQQLLLYNIILIIVHLVELVLYLIAIFTVLFVLSFLCLVDDSVDLVVI